VVVIVLVGVFLAGVAAYFFIQYRNKMKHSVSQGASHEFFPGRYNQLEESGL
jgi:hypothetical protein